MASILKRGSISPSPDTSQSNAHTRTSRALGQVFTPRIVADWMVRWACAHRPRRVLDPAFGKGVFVDSLLAQVRRKGGTPPKVAAFEIDPRLVVDADNVRRPGLRLRNEDFIPAAVTERFDAILANPPYVRHHELNYPGRVMKAFDALCGEPISRTTNLYGLFLLKIWSLLGSEGRAAVITPAEWLNADFGIPIKRCLLRENAIDAIVHFDHDAQVFEGVLTTAAITLLRRGRRTGEPVRLVRAASSHELMQLCVDSSDEIFRKTLDPTRKWTLHCLGFNPEKSNGPVLRDVARCTRGIATGANDYFTFRPSELGQWRIDLRDVTPCITKARQITRSHFTQADFRRLEIDDQPVYLLSPRPSLSAALRAYLKVGRTCGISRRYLPAHRTEWFRPEARPPAPILVSVFAREQFRFVWNQARVRNLTAYHGIYPHDRSPSAARALFRYLISDQARAALRPHVRIYADGLLKVEPRDVEAMPIPTHLLH